MTPCNGRGNRAAGDFAGLRNRASGRGWSVCLLMVLLVVISCDDRAPTETEGHVDRSVVGSKGWGLVPTDTVRLFSDKGAGPGDIHEWAISPDGQMAAVDRAGGAVHIFSPEGQLQQVLGSSQPLGEPMDATFLHDGQIVVATLGQPQIHVFAADGTHSHSFDLPGMLHALKVDRVAKDRIVIFNHRRQPTLDRVGVYDVRGNLLAHFHPSREAYYSVPYWESTTERLLATTNSRIVAGGNLMYPLAVYEPNGTVLDSIGSAPPGWEAPSRPDRGAFAGGNGRREFEQWRRTFTSITKLAFVGDSLLAVAHERLDPSVLAYDRSTYSLDLYAGGRPVVRNHPLPGPLLGGGEQLWVLTGHNPEHWAVQTYRVRVPESP